MIKTNFNPLLLTDFYKVGHISMYPEGTEKIYSTLTPRSNKHLKQVDEVVVFGVQAFVKKYLIEYFNENFFNKDKEKVVNEYKRTIKNTLGIEKVKTDHIEELHDLGYLPIELRAIEEGTRVPIKTPVVTIENTHPKFFWVTNYLETLFSTEVWHPMTTASIAYQYRKILDKYAIETTGSTDGVNWQAHDFSMRGMSSIESASASGAGHLLSFTGTDTIPAIAYLEKYYNADVEKELVGGSVYATEHSIQCANTPADSDRDEYKSFKRLITEVVPEGIISIVSDTYDLWDNVTRVLPMLKDEIVSRNGKAVIRPDSGIPEDILCGKINYDIDLTKDYDYLGKEIKNLEDDIYDLAREWASDDCEGSHNCGNDYYVVKFKVHDKIYKVKVGFSYNRHDKTYYYVEQQGFKSEGVQWDTLEELETKAEDKGLVECLWDIFGGTVNELGYKVLDSHIGAIYGDSITLERAETICKRLKEKGFASTNVVLGVGSWSYMGLLSRDSLGWAVKATYAEINGKPVKLMKEPKTDLGKKSQRGKVLVQYDRNTNEIITIDGLTNHPQDEDAIVANSLLKPVFKDGKLLRDQSLSEIRKILWSVQ